MLLRRRRRIGVTGLGNAGKSVFLTSLLSHLEEHDPERLALGRDGRAQVRSFRRLPLPPGRSPFDWEACRRTMVESGQWPAKTRDNAHVRCSFRRSDWSYTDIELHLFDFAGERLADAVMLGRDHAGWSDAVLAMVRSDVQAASLAGELEAALSKPEVSAGELVHAYRLLLARLALSYRSLVTPSTFLLDTEGRMAQPGRVEAIAAARAAGFADAELAPVPTALRTRRPDLARLFDARYEVYLRRVVTPVFSELARCHRLLVLVDVPGLLMGGTGRYNDQRMVLKRLFTSIDPRRGLPGRLAGAATKLLAGDRLRFGGISRVALVASKADLVAPVDRGNLLALLRDMARRPAEDASWKVATFTAAAVISTRAGEEGARVLSGRPLLDERGTTLSPEAPPRTFRVSAVPERWPETWEAGSFSFPDVYPEVPRRVDLPPRQIGLGGILEFLLAESLLE